MDMNYISSLAAPVNPWAVGGMALATGAGMGFGGSLGSLVPAGLSYLGTREQNEMNYKIMQEQMAFQRESAEKQMGFQERMSNTSHQRAVQDMVAAGLNPLLALHGGASTPGGSAPQGSSARMESPLKSAVSSAMQYKMLEAQLEQQKSTAELQRAQTEMQKVATQIARTGLPEKELEADIYKSKPGRILKWVDEIMGPIQKVFGGIKSGKDAFDQSKFIK